MTTISATLATAQARAKQANLPYQGALTPAEAAYLLQAAPGTKLVDVRTRAELDWVGRIAGAVEIEWLTYPSMKANEHFLTHLQQQVETEALVLFICRSGGRSHAAATAASQAGYTTCYNVLEGFEGDVDAHKQRNKTSGWRAARLPWQQS
ncbi:MAG: rhodanese-like domain-containing protein [Sideroxydans sp.]|nr:rhodanese-like domain-containing protein [Sideroxydans sp.]